MDGNISDALTITRRDLPHWQAGGSTYFITFRLRGARSFPSGNRRRTLPGPPLTAQERRIVRDDILFWHQRRWHVHVLTVMPDHVHILATPQEEAPRRWYSLSRILASVKAGAALKINRLRGRRGSLWQSESFDRIVRDEREFDEKAIYILSNAVKAELVKDGWEYDGFWCDGLMDSEEKGLSGPDAQ